MIRSNLRRAIGDHAIRPRASSLAAAFITASLLACAESRSASTLNLSGEQGGAEAFVPVPPRNDTTDRLEGPVLRHRPLGLGSTRFSYVSSLRLLNDSLLLVSDRGTSPHLSIIDITSGEAVRRLGVHGNGRNQFTDPAWVGTRRERGALQSWILDWPARRIVQLSTDMVGANARIVHTLDLQSKSRGFVNAAGALDVPTWAVVQGSRIFIGGMLLDRSFEEWNRDGFVRSFIVDPPFTESRVPYPLSRQALSVTLGTGAPNGQRFAILHQYSSRVDILDSVGARVARAEGPDAVSIVVKEPSAAERGEPGHGSHHIRVTSVDSSEIGYTAITSTENFVYGAFCGCRRGASAEPRTVHVFDWSGNFVRELLLDRFVGHFSVLGDTLLIGVVGTNTSNARDLSLSTWRIEPRLELGGLGATSDSIKTEVEQ